MQNEECSWKAVDDLKAKVELEAANAEVGRLRAALDTAEARLRVVSELRREGVRQSAAVWGDKVTRSASSSTACSCQGLSSSPGPRTHPTSTMLSPTRTSWCRAYTRSTIASMTALKELNNLLAQTTTTAQKMKMCYSGSGGQQNFII
jgi:hypothetical protein